MEENGRKSYVYLLGDWERDGVYKIGVTRGDIDKRIKKLQTGNSGEIYLIDYYQTERPFMVEKLMHDKFFPDKKIGEWFELSFEDRVNFKKLCSFYDDMFDSISDNPFVQNIS